MCPAERCNGILFSRGKMAFSKNTALTIVYQKPKKKKKEPQNIPHTIYKNQLKMDCKHKCKPKYKTPRRKHR